MPALTSKGHSCGNISGAASKTSVCRDDITGTSPWESDPPKPDAKNCQRILLGKKVCEGVSTGACCATLEGRVQGMQRCRVKASLCVVVPSTTVGPDNDQTNPKWAPHNHNYALLNQDRGLGKTPHGTVHGKRGEGNLPEEAFDKIFT